MHNEDANVTISNHRHVLDIKFLHTKESWVSRVHEMKKEVKKRETTHSNLALVPFLLISTKSNDRDYDGLMWTSLGSQTA